MLIEKGNSSVEATLTRGQDGTQSFVLPFWGQVKPFALTSGAQFRPGPPAVLGSAAFLEQANYVVEIQQVAHLLARWKGLT